MLLGHTVLDEDLAFEHFMIALECIQQIVNDVVLLDGTRGVNHNVSVIGILEEVNLSTKYY